MTQFQSNWLKLAAALQSPSRLKELELFREQLSSPGGEELCISIGLEEVSLADYLGWILKARHAAVYQRDGEIFKPTAWFGSKPESILSDSPLPRWMAQNGALIRSKLSLSGLSIDEAEYLLGQLEQTAASLVVPIMLNEQLWGFFLLGGPFIGEYDSGTCLYLSLYGLELARRTSPHWEPRAQKEYKALRQTQEFWTALRPARSRVKLLIFDEEIEAIACLKPFFENCGLEVQGATTQEETRLLLQQFRPQLFLRTARDKIILRSDGEQVLPKPSRFASLARTVFEAAVNTALVGKPLHAA